jgi:hypothetical protein
MDIEEIRRQQREKIRQVRERQAAIERHAAEWDPLITQMLQQIGQQVWGGAARLRHWHATWEVHRPTPDHPHFRVSLECDAQGEPTHFVVKCAAGELTTEPTEAALAETLKQAVVAGPATWE